MGMATDSTDRIRGIRLTEEQYIRTGHHIAARRQQTVNFPMHFHSYFELEIVLDGHGTQTLSGESYEVGAGDVYLLTPTDYHCVLADTEHLTLWNIVFDEHALSEETLRRVAAGGIRPRTLSPAQQDRADRLCALLAEECEEEGPRCDSALLESLFCLLFRAFADIGTHRTGEHTDEIAKACRYLQTHFRDAPPLAEIAAHVGFHPAYFSEQFKKTVGVSYIERLNELRIGYAKNLLAQGLRVSEACFGAGFGSLSNFQHCFQQSVGCSPREFRKKCK